MTLSLTGCSYLGVGTASGGPRATTEAQAAMARPMDPLARFASEAAPGSSGAVTLASGQTVSAFLLRSYNAASGRECREVQYGQASDTRSQVFCNNGVQWVAARPLLRGGAVARP
ncbi:hypothetical protein IAI18_06055 [Acetobacteraceae bacterium H6797]|nr:hypothetical protein [Acetobacteraceae bacterium H6797]